MRPRFASLITFAASLAVLVATISSAGFAQDEDAAPGSGAPTIPAPVPPAEEQPAADAPPAAAAPASEDAPAASVDPGYEGAPSAGSAPSTLDDLSARAGAQALDSSCCPAGCGAEGCTGDCCSKLTALSADAGARALAIVNANCCRGCGDAGCTGGCCTTDSACAEEAEGCVRLGGGCACGTNGCNGSCYGWGSWSDHGNMSGMCKPFDNCQSCWGNGQSCFGNAYGGCCRGIPGSVCCCSKKAFPDDGWAMPVRHPIHRTRIQYQRYWPTHWYGNPAAQYPSHYPMVYRPTDTTQLGFSYHHVPTWMPNRAMEPAAPHPNCYHHRYCPGGANCCNGMTYARPVYYQQPCQTCPTPAQGVSQPIPGRPVTGQPRIAFYPANGQAVPRFLTPMYPQRMAVPRSNQAVRPVNYSR